MRASRNSTLKFYRLLGAIAPSGMSGFLEFNPKSLLETVLSLDEPA
ncbi:MAG: hypothetical protein SW833_00725 [Cyanobacteriota bacterium]|nr:hypothetical protein [Cyanobacteriota bacterium]